MRTRFAAVLLVLVTLLALAFVPSLTDFNANQFSSPGPGNKVNISSGSLQTNNNFFDSDATHGVIMWDATGAQIFNTTNGGLLTIGAISYFNNWTVTSNANSFKIEEPVGTNYTVQFVTTNASGSYVTNIETWGGSVSSTAWAITNASGGLLLLLDTNGNLTINKSVNANSLSYTWPSAQAGGNLFNNGSGGLTWVAGTNVAIPNTFIQTNVALNTVFTNNSGSLQFLRGSALLTTGAGVVGNSALDVFVDQTGGITFVRGSGASNQTTALSLAGNFKQEFGLVVSNNAVWYLTNSSTAGDSSSLVPGSFQITTLADGTAAGVALLSANNVFTGNNTSPSFSYTAYTTATLPAGQSTGTKAYATDAITPAGTGSEVWYDGTSWRLIGYNIKATSDIPSFATNCLEAGNWFSSRATDFRVDPEEYDPHLINFFRNSLTANSGAVGNFTTTTTFGGFGTFEANTSSASGAAGAYSAFVPAVAASIYYGCGGTYYVNVLPTTASAYWCFVGMNSLNTLAFPVEGCGFVFDMNTNNVSVNTFIAGLAGAAKSATNDWLAMTVHGSAYSYVDTGLPVGIASATAQRLGVYQTNGATVFTTNGAVACTITANQPTTSMYLCKAIMQKTVGTTDAFLNEAIPWRFIRHPIRTQP